jgi:hypothetical protein
VSDDLAAQIEKRLDIIAGRRRTDQFFQWISGVAGTVVTAALIGLTVTVIGLKTSTAVSTAELKGAIKELTAQLGSIDKLAGATALAAIQRIERLEKHVEAVDGRVRELERLRPSGGPR